MGVRAPPDQGAHADRRLHRRRGGPPAGHGVARSSRRTSWPSGPWSSPGASPSVPTMTALMIKESVNQTVDNMGFYNSLQACFTLHQLNHSHWAEIHESKYPVAEPEDGIPSWQDAPRSGWPCRRGGGTRPRLGEAPTDLPPGRRRPVPAARGRLGRPHPRPAAVVAAGRARPGHRRRGRPASTPPTLERLVAGAVAGGLRRARRPPRGRRGLAAAQLVGGGGPVPGLLAVRGGGRAHPPPGGGEPRSGAWSTSLQPAVSLAVRGHALWSTSGDDRCAGRATRELRRPAAPAGRLSEAGRPGSDVAVVLFTSGSTGAPQGGAAHQPRPRLQGALDGRRPTACPRADAALMPSPLAHVSGLLNSVLVPGAAAMPVVLMEKWDPELGVRLAGRAPGLVHDRAAHPVPRHDGRGRVPRPGADPAGGVLRRDGGDARVHRPGPGQASGPR